MGIVFPRRCFVATSNPGKLKEITEIGKEFFPEIKEWVGRAAKVADETEVTFLGNARIKSHALFHELSESEKWDSWVLSDDSGLEVDALNGAPGVYTALYAGDHVSPELHMKKLLKELSHVEKLVDRSARYVCALSLLIAEEVFFESEGYCAGFINFDRQGVSGFGYDPVFLLEDMKTPMANLSSIEKNRISHRWNAFENLKKVLLSL